VTKGPRTLGIVGTMVSDRIIPVGRDPFVGWGGVGYAVAGAVATLPSNWSVRVVSRVGKDVIHDVRSLFSNIPRCDAHLVKAQELNNRVEIVYKDSETRTETLFGGVSGWRADELVQALEGCDATLVNFISGNEVDLDGMLEYRSRSSGMIYADLHSLFLHTEPDGKRTPRPLNAWRSWLSCFDVVQMNKEEYGLLTETSDGPRGFEDLLLAGPRIASVTFGSGGVIVAYRVNGRTFVEEVTVQRQIGDPTGCGDVWGAVMFGRLLAGMTPVASAHVANRVAAESVDHRGIEGLTNRLADASRDILGD
jgi:sugar/nucleoside kinase (ribokinase family)